MAKRKPGDGSIRLRKDGRWEGRAVIGYDEKGLPKTKNVLAKTKTECAEKLKQLKEEIGAESPKPKADRTFGEWIDFWYRTYSKPHLRSSTAQEYESNIYRVFFIFDDGQIVVLFNGFHKKTQKTPKQEIEKALKIKEAYYADKQSQNR